MAAIKALQQWCRVQCDGYRDVSITNMTTSFRDGMAFCALLHKHRPDLIDFDSLKKEDVYENNKLAFSVAETQLGIPALLDAEDMVALKVPDRLSILTYVSQYYNYFHGRSPIGGMGGMGAVKRPAESNANEPPGKKNQPVMAKVFPGSKPARENIPPSPSNGTKTHPAPRQTANILQEAKKNHSTGTLSNKCASCNGHVHLVQRQLVDGKLYHRNCAKTLTNSSSLLRDLPKNTAPFTASPRADPVKPGSPPAKPSRTWISQPSDQVRSPPDKPSPTRPAEMAQTPAGSNGFRPGPSDTSTRSFGTKPSPAPQSSTTAAITLQSKMKFFQAKEDQLETTKPDPSEPSRLTQKPEVNKTSKVTIKLEPNRVLPAATKSGPSQGLLVTTKPEPSKVFHVTTKPQPTKVLTTQPDLRKTSHEAPKAPRSEASGDPKQERTRFGAGPKETQAVAGVKGEDEKKKEAAVFLSRKLAEDKPEWTTVVLKKTDEPSQVRGRVKLRANPALLADLKPGPDAQNSAPSPASRAHSRPTSAERPRPAERVNIRDQEGAKTNQATPSSSGAESPANWRSRLKPLPRDAKPAASPQASPKPWRRAPPPPTSDPPPAKDIWKNQAASPSTAAQVNPSHIPREEIQRELQQIEDNVDALEREGVELEKKLRRSEEEGEDDSVMDDLMVRWFTLIRNKQVAVRRESELVQIARIQELEEQQAVVDKELRQLMDKPDHLKQPWERSREEQLVEKLVEIVEDRNAIVEHLDEDRLREKEEDAMLIQMMRTFSFKTEKPKKKSPKSKFFSWGSKKDESRL